MDRLGVRRMLEKDAAEVIAMMRDLYSSSARLSTPSDDVLERCVEDGIGECPFVDGWIIETGGEVAGFMMVARSYSTELGGLCSWLEDIYVKPEHRGKGLGRRALGALRGLCAEALRFRVDVAPSDEGARAFCESEGFRELGYVQYVDDR